MNLDLVIGQIKALAPMFNGNVAGAAAFANGIEDQAWLTLPAAYVVPLNEDAEPNEDMTGLNQAVTERIQVIVNFDNAFDRRGQSVTNAYESTRLALFGAILNWRPDSSIDNPGLVDSDDPAANRAARGLYYGGGQLLEFDRRRLFYAWTFCLDTLVTDADGWQPPSQALLAIELTDPPVDPGDPPAQGGGPGLPAPIDIPLAQS